MLSYMLGVSSLSILLSLVDLVSSIKTMSTLRTEKAMLMEEISKGEQSCMFTTRGTAEAGDVLLTRRISSSGSSNDAVKDGNYSAVGSNGEINTKVFGATIIKTDESACDKSHLPTPMSTPVPTPFNLHTHLRRLPLNPKVPPLIGVKNVILCASITPNSGQQSDNVESQDKRAWV